MKKIVTLVIVIAVILGGVVFSINHIAKGGIETVGSNVTGTSVNVAGVSISLLSGEGNLNQFKIANPEGFSQDIAFSVEDILVKVEPASLLSDTIVIEEILIDRPKLSYEIGTKGNNIEILKKNAKRYSNSGKNAGADEPVADSSSGSSKKVIIKDLRIVNGQVQLAANLFQKGDSQTMPLPEIHLQDIGGSQGGVKVSDAAMEVLAAIQTGIAKVDPKNLKGSVDSIKERIKGLF